MDVQNTKKCSESVSGTLEGISGVGLGKVCAVDSCLRRPARQEIYLATTLLQWNPIKRSF